MANAMIHRKWLLALLLASPLPCTADDKPPAKGDETAPAANEPAEPLEERVGKATALNTQKSVLIDKANGRLYLKTKVCLREGLLEMFLCKAKSKEHESIVSIDSNADIIHGGLLALGAKAVHPVQFQPTYSPPEGSKIDVWANWTDADGKAHRMRAQDWIRGLTRRYYSEKIGPLPAGLEIPKDSDLKYIAIDEELIWFGPMSDEQQEKLLNLSKNEAYQKAIKKFHDASQFKPMTADFVFGGSGFHEAKDGTRWYKAEAGNLICVANFSDAMIDVSIRSSDVNAEASFEPYTDRIPPVGTPVIVELVPELDAKEKEPAR
jgi:hypothetical protein